MRSQLTPATSPQITTIKSSLPHRHNTIMVVSTSYRCHHDLELKYNNQILIAMLTSTYMTYVNFVYESSCSLFNMETIHPMAVINISQQSATKEGGGDDKSGRRKKYDIEKDDNYMTIPRRRWCSKRMGADDKKEDNDVFCYYFWIITCWLMSFFLWYYILCLILLQV